MIQLDAETEQRLAELAAIQNISVEELIANFALDEKAALRARIQKAAKQIENGDCYTISSPEESSAFFESIITECKATKNS